MDNISKELLFLADIDAIIDRDSFPIANDNSNNTEIDNIEGENPLNSEIAGSDEMCLIPNIYNYDQGVLDVAPDEVTHSVFRHVQTTFYVHITH